MSKSKIINQRGKIAESELILNPDGSIYHLKLKPDQLAKNVIVVGDPGRVELVSSRFDKIECKIISREFVTHTGYFNNKRVTALSTGIGTDNIDIVLNELDALVNIDLEKRMIKSDHTSLNIVRIGTSGALQKDIPVDSFVLSSYGLGFDGLLHFYETKKNMEEKQIVKSFIKYSGWNKKFAKPYIVKASETLEKKLGADIITGITATAPGFYGPQGRSLRLGITRPDLNEMLTAFDMNGMRITNFEMETSALYGLSKLLGHNACTICTIVANRIIKQYSKDYKKSVEMLIDLVLQRLTA